MKTSNDYQKIVPFIIFILALILLFKLVQPMITILLGSVLLAYVTFPIYNKISKKIRNKSFSIILSLFIIFIIILIPFAFIAFEVTKQGYHFYGSLSDTIEKGEVFGFGCISEDSKICSTINYFEKFSSEQLSASGLDKQLQKIKPILAEKITQFISSLPLIFAGIFLSLFIAYYILYDWKNILKKIIYILPVRTKTTNRLIKEFGNITYTVVYAQLFVALVQGTIGTIGFYIFGVPSPIFLGLAIAFCSLIPTMGTALIWGPASLFLILNGYFYHDNGILIRGIGLLLYGLLIIGTIDNILLAKIVHAKAKVSQIVIITGVIGGAVMFGIIGIFIGPIILPLLLTYFETFRERSV
ncbi:MAG: AI-2E family transporter [Candidatus Woesearchaeota archaeon]